eukprot:CAMPEP_0115141472 /NCGR_PEP_ID=MMETSP0227-20121206/59557_1 /TAXON_ID=89957 /ORGANISM="Polarella glacialis, Strain CCMP 1383" /LENGTH=213 /DNA_ID=CAMNT_0002549839 /DNA_START=33 /DNA_END=674 /DNA_ORIENTATION=-
MKCTSHPEVTAYLCCAVDFNPPPRKLHLKKLRPPCVEACLRVETRCLSSGSATASSSAGPGLSFGAGPPLGLGATPLEWAAGGAHELNGARASFSTSGVGGAVGASEHLEFARALPHRLELDALLMPRPGNSDNNSKGGKLLGVCILGVSMPDAAKLAEGGGSGAAETLLTPLAGVAASHGLLKPRIRRLSRSGRGASGGSGTRPPLDSLAMV